MELNPKSWHAWLYRVSFQQWELPTNLCPYFWKLSLAVLMLPFHWPFALFFLIFKRKGPENCPSIYWHPLFVFLGFTIGFHGLMRNATGDSNLSWRIFLELYPGVAGFYYTYLCGMLWLLIATLVLFGIIGLCVGIVLACEKWFPTKKYVYEEPKPKKKWILIEYIKAWYNKNCPRIIWKKL